MLRKLVPCILALLALLASPSAGRANPLGDISAFLNHIHYATADFIQVNSDGTRSPGHLSLHRPGRLRLDYKTSSINGLLIANSGEVAIFDPIAKGPPAQYPLGQTPLGPILAAQVDLAASPFVRGVARKAGAIYVRVQDHDHPDYGTGTFVFTSHPLTLIAWRMVNSAGDTTTMLFSHWQFPKSLPSELFDIISETAKRSGR